MFNEEQFRRIQVQEEKWKREILAKTLERFAERKKQFETDSKLPLERVYSPLHIEKVNYTKEVAFPGEYPFTRGIYPTMYRGRLWTMRQYAGFGTAQQTNKRFKYLLHHGQTGLSVAFDLPTQMGFDCDQALARGEVGKVGVSVSSLRDMEILFNGIPLDKVTTSMTINAPATVLLAMYAAVGEKQGVPQAKLDGTVQNDILKEYVARGLYIFPPKASMKLVTDIFEYCAKNMPKWNTISISGYHIREAGATAPQEIAFTLANGIAYVGAATERGLNLDEFAGRLSFFFAAQNNFLEEIAKFRAARRLWAKIMHERFKAKNLASWQLRFHTQTSGVALTAQQPLNNVIRVTLQALAAVLGGTQSLHTNSFDEAYATPTEEAVTIALRTQQIIGYESGVTDTVDPLAGSYCIESMTNRIEEEAVKYIDKIDEMGGAVAAIEKGYMQREIVESAYRHQREIEANERVVVGLNQFATERKTLLKTLRVNPVVEEKQVETLKTLRRKRDNRKVDAALDRLQKAVNRDDNLMPIIIGAVREYATLGEICEVLRQVYGDYRAPTIF
ncbi:MAG TPA: methylmalonyl-CoA mutase family protein [Candidatus Bathyarchaeia archaeon]|nr:methylmalonyl-CoA mutase family protein [Candidatus Bathyarchaeia archaeon]